MSLGRRDLLARLLATLMALGAFPCAAEAHGPVSPVASSYLAKLGEVPAGLEAKVVDADQRIWLRVSLSETVVVLDYRGAPYLRFATSGVEVNQNSAMYYLNQTPVAETPPPGLSRITPPHWHWVTSAHEYAWHDGRLHALATVALAPTATYVGRWTIPVLIGGHLTSIAGVLWHRSAPSIVWFWPILVLLACVWAARRLRRPRLDVLVARALAVAALIVIAAAAAGRGLHGRPSVSVLQLIELGITLAFVAWGLHRVLFRRPGYFAFFVIAFVALWEGAILIPTLVHGYVLISLPAFVARAATVVCLGTGVGLLLQAFRLSEPTADRAGLPARRVGPKWRSGAARLRRA